MGQNYSIVLRNSSAERIGVVIAVDGRNIISGKRSDLRSDETMYIVDAYNQGRFDGWRTTDSEVHRFYFTDPGDSYGIKTFNDATAMGVIAVAVFREKRQTPVPGQTFKKESPSTAAPSAENSNRGSGKVLADDSAGTGFGDSRYSPVVRVAFEPERSPVLKTLVKYEWTGTLCRKGILRCGQEHRNRLWDEDGYAPYPPGFR